MRRNVSIALVVLITVFSLNACATQLRYSAEPIEAWVVDADSRQPLEGVVVVANWELETTSRIVPHQTNEVGSLVILETVTDKNGRFYFPGWGPKWHLGSGELTDSDPELIFFKSGYEYRRVSNSRYLRPRKYSDEGKPSGTESKPTGSKRISFWSGERIELKAFNGTMKEYVGNFDNFNEALDQLISWSPKDCNWKKLPQAILATEHERKKLLAQIGEKKEVDPRTIGSTYQDVIYNNDWYTKKGGYSCGSPKVFFERDRP